MSDDANHKIGGVVDRITTAVKEFGVSPFSPVVVRVGDFGPEMLIEHVKVQGGVNGPKLVLQCQARN